MARFPRLDWTGSDYDAIRADLIARINTAFSDWTDTNPANPGMALAELVSYIGDLVRYYQDRQANEAFLITAQERANVIRHLQEIGYVLASAAPATVALEFTIPVQPYPVVFDAGDRITTADGTVGVELDDKLEIPAGETTGTVDATEGTTVQEDLGTADGTPGLKFTLGQAPFIFGSEVIVVDGVAWTRVSDFLSSGAGDQVYTVSVDADDKATVVFGDGTNGSVPPDGAQISSSYRIGGGAIGNVEAGTLTRLTKSYTNTAGQPVKVTVTNPAKATDGTDRESTAHGKLYGPKSLATAQRSISESDFETNAELVSGVARALAQTVDDDPIIDENSVLVQIVPVGSGTPTQDLLDAVYTMLTVTRPKTNTTRLMVVPALYLDFAPVGTVYVARSQPGQAVLQARLEAVGDALMDDLVAYADATNIDVEAGDFTVHFGERIPLSDLYNVLGNKARGVKYFDLASPTEDLVLAAKYFPRLRTFTKSIDLSGDKPKVIYTWTGPATQLVVQEEP